MSLLLSLMLAAAPIGGAKSDDLSVQAMHNFGACVVRTTPAGAEEVLAMDFRTEAYQKKLRRLAKGHGRCTRSRTELKFNGVLFAGAMAEALVEERKGGVIAASQPASPLAARSPLENMALCTVVTSPAEVSKLLATDVTTAEEHTAIEALSPTLNACLSGADKAEINKVGLRSVLALAAWRIASSSPNSSEGAE